MNQKRINAVNFFTVLTLCVMLLFCILPIHGEDEIYSKVLRLHVIANSDSELDQSLKLEVRDAVLEYTAPLLAGTASREEAADIIRAHKVEIEAAARERLAVFGREDEARLVVCAERYPMKDYERFCFPSGEYLSVKLMIGEAEGQNWWCVLFPRLCTDMAVSKEEEFIAVGFTPDQYKIITESENATYKIRFRLLEYFEEMRAD